VGVGVGGRPSIPIDCECNSRAATGGENAQAGVEAAQACGDGSLSDQECGRSPGGAVDAQTGDNGSLSDEECGRSPGGAIDALTAVPGTAKALGMFKDIEPGQDDVPAVKN